MKSEARASILARLQAAAAQRTSAPAGGAASGERWSRQEKIERLCRLMQAMRAEVHTVKAAEWGGRLRVISRERGWKSMICGANPDIQSQLAQACKETGGEACRLTVYAEPFETFKGQLFEADAGITTTIGAVADSGAVILWPSPAEPRLLSLVPQVHVALVEADNIYSSLAEAMRLQRWKDKMPTNALLISGPSKTADIEFTLVFGVHGPKEMIVLILE